MSEAYRQLREAARHWRDLAQAALAEKQAQWNEVKRLSHKHNETHAILDCAVIWWLKEGMQHFEGARNGSLRPDVWWTAMSDLTDEGEQ